MDTGVSLRRPIRQCAVLVAAYAVALQAVFSAFALPTHGPGAAAFEVCRSDRADGPVQPLAHEACPACLAGHCGTTGPDRIAVAEAWPVLDRSDAVRQPEMASVPVPRRLPHAPRAPPLG
jgi:hypothetical protein